MRNPRDRAAFRQGRAHPRVGGDSTGDDQQVGSGRTCRASCPSRGPPVGQHVHHSLLETGCEIRAFLVRRRDLAQSRHRLGNRGLQSRQAQIAARRGAASGRGKGYRFGSPASASFSSAGPPGQSSPSSLATLSKASPTASSTVPPRRICLPTSRYRDALGMAAGQQEQQIGERLLRLRPVREGGRSGHAPPDG